jgi:hypothetical protein
MYVSIPLNMVPEIIMADRAAVSSIEAEAVEIASIARELNAIVQQVVTPRPNPQETIWQGPDAVAFGKKIEEPIGDLAGACAKLQACAAGLLQETVALERQYNERMSRPSASPWDSRPA